MIKALAIAILALAACKSSESSEKPATQKTQTPGADPWSKDKGPKVDPKTAKDPDLATMIELAKNGPDQTAYPQADAIVALDRDDISIGIDGTVTEHHKSIVKLLDAQRGKEKFADVHIGFDTKRQQLTIQTARTVNADGEPHVASPEEIGDIVPPRLADATIYSDVRERVVSFPAVDKGSVVELEYTRTTQATPDAPMGGEQMLGQWDPVLERIVTITVATSASPKLEVVGADLKATESSTPDGHMWTYKLEKLPDQHPEQASPADAAVLPRLLYSFQPSWAKVLEPVAERFLRASVPATPTPAIKQEAERITEGAKSETDKASKLYAFVAHDIRSVDLPLGWAGYEPHAPDVVLQNRYADNRDKVGLLLALAAAQGIQGRPVLVRTGRVPVIASVPTIAQFDHVIAKLTVDGKEVWVDPSDEYGQYGVAFTGEDNLVLPLEKGGSELGQRPPLDPSTSISQVNAQFALSANGDLDAKYAYEMSGWYADRATEQLRPLKGEHLTQFFQQAAAELSAAALDKGHDVGDTMSVSGAFKVTHHVSVPGYSAAQGNFRVFELPPVSLGVADDAPSASLSVRKYPLSIGVPRTEKSDVTLQVPAGWKVSYVPPKLEGSSEGVSFSSVCTTAGQSVTCHDEIKLDKLVLPADKYPAFRDAITKLQAYERRIVLLTKG
ncbi:MAG: transglutaminase protein [Myxococcales bacterium]|nr:transglutaminase protein [Myxococcales bacterium]